MNQSVANVAGHTLDFSVLPMQEQLQIVDFFNFLKAKKSIQPVTTERTLHLDDLFEMVKIELPADYKFDRDEAYER